MKLFRWFPTRAWELGVREPCPVSEHVSDGAVEGPGDYNRPLAVITVNVLPVNCRQMTDKTMVRWKALSVTSIDSWYGTFTTVKNMAHLRQSRPDSGVDFQAKVL